MSHVIVVPCIKRANTQNLLFGFLFFVFEVFSSDLIVPSPVNNFKSLKQKYRLVRSCRDVLLVTKQQISPTIPSGFTTEVH